MNLEEVCKGFRALLKERRRIGRGDVEYQMLADAFEEAGLVHLSRYLRERVENLHYWGGDDLGIDVQKGSPEQWHFRDPANDEMPFCRLRNYMTGCE